MICARCKTILPHVASSSDYCSACGDFLRLQQKHDTLRTELDKVLFDYDDLVQRNKTIHAELENERQGHNECMEGYDRLRQALEAILSLQLVVDRTEIFDDDLTALLVRLIDEFHKIARLALKGGE